jgi:hypothetical protein
VLVDAALALPPLSTAAPVGIDTKTSPTPVIPLTETV